MPAQEFSQVRSAQRARSYDGRGSSDPDAVQPVAGDVVHDFPNNGWRMRELAEGIHYTVVNGEVLLEKGTHTGSYPGRVLHNARYHATHNGRG